DPSHRPARKYRYEGRSWRKFVIATPFGRRRERAQWAPVTPEDQCLFGQSSEYSRTSPGMPRPNRLDERWARRCDRGVWDWELSVHRGAAGASIGGLPAVGSPRWRSPLNLETGWGHTPGWFERCRRRHLRQRHS